MATFDRERVMALRRGAEGADPRGNVAIRTDDLLFLTAIAVETLPKETNQQPATPIEPTPS